MYGVHIDSWIWERFAVHTGKERARRRERARERGDNRNGTESIRKLQPNRIERWRPATV
jgi:hypothetical protein